ncbi:MAG: L-threonylcarbamoyladenylate synthase [Treponema sp.]|jgi:tRNA threonylcarbamoyl adenosine modification protein (Sua5/YciO/YrdC/YwlC family)|nr:L-threonylcarbamoyladenylate synthase [Treponema sp.]
MIEYIVSENIDDRVLSRTAALFEEGALAAFPSDTSWLIGCSFRSRGGLKKLRALASKGAETAGQREERNFTLLCSDIAQFGEFCSIDNTRFRLIKRLTPGPYVFILKTLLGTEKALNLKRGEIGVRIPNHPVPLALINTLGFPLYSVTAKKTMLELDAEYDEGEELFDGGWELDEIEGLDIILDTGDERPHIHTTVLDLRDETELIRAGAGLWPV